MKKKTSLIYLATAFLAVIGCNAALLVGYILAVYPSRATGSPAGNTARSSDTAIIQSNVPANETALISPDTVQNAQTIPENQESVTVDNTLLSDTVTGYDPAKQEIFDELARNRQISENQKYVLSESEQKSTEGYVPVQDSQKTYTPAQNAQEARIPVQNSQEVYTPVQNAQETVTPLQDAQYPVTPEPSIYEADSQNNADNSLPASSDNSNRFYTYNNPHLQQTTDAFVINTKSRIFHLPKCKDVARMSEENYSTSNSSYEELSKDYKPCGHCLDKD